MSERDELIEQAAALLQARMPWRQAEGCARDLVGAGWVRVSAGTVERVSATVHELDATRRAADRLAAALAIALYDAHPTYSSTAKWRGGIGGQAMTTHCSMLQPPPGDDWMDAGFDLLSGPLREWLELRGDVDLPALKDELRAECQRAIASPPTTHDGGGE